MLFKRSVQAQELDHNLPEITDAANDEATEEISDEANDEASETGPIDLANRTITGRIIIRTHKDEDRQGARALLKAHHQSTLFANYAFSDKKFDEMADQIVAKPDHMICLVAELNGEIVGLSWATAGSYALSEELMLTTCHVVAVHPTKLGRLKRVKTFVRLIKGVKSWAQTRGADQVLVHVTTGTNLKATDRILKRAGAKVIGGGYVV